ncbi:MAG: hypothetical protein ACE10F_11965 [Candidatus Methylomirabilales bacterium]
MKTVQAVTDRPAGWTVEDDERAVAVKEKSETAGAALVKATEHLAALRTDRASQFLLLQAQAEVEERETEWKKLEAAWHAVRKVVHGERKSIHEAEYRKVVAKREIKIDEAVAAEREIREVWQHALAEGIELSQDPWVHFLSPEEMWHDAFTNWGDPPPWKFRRDALKAQGYL